MVRLSCALAALLVSGGSASSIRSPTQNISNRKLSYEYIANYMPGSSVTDHNAIDGDQAALEVEVAKKTQTGFDKAKDIYENGGHSKSYAKLTTDNTSFNIELSSGTQLTGKDDDDNDVIGKVYKPDDTPVGEIWLQYQTTDVQSSHVGCKVGALGGTDFIKTSGCFKEDGAVSIGATSYEYTYDKLENNKNGRTIKGFSTAVAKKMLECTNCPYFDAEMFHDYYGDSDYGDKWVQAALSGSRTQFTSGRGNADFSLYSFEGRGECVKKGTAYLSIFMYVIREFEDALDDCKSNCINCNDDPVHAWDEGVAFYSGSMESTNGVPSGKLLHQLADKRCKNYGTCYDEENTKSKVNRDLLDLFNKGQDQLLTGRCEEARETKEKIADIMYIPLIQGTIRYAFKVDKKQGGEKEKAEGAVFAAAVLPKIYKYDKEAAQYIYDNMRVGASSTNFAKVKDMFERTYSHLHISCDDIGGLVDDDGKYFDGAKPCYDNESKGGMKTGEIVGLVIGIVGGVVALIAVGMVLRMRSREKAGNPIFKPNENPEQTTVY